MSAIVTINTFIADAVLVWRVEILCADELHWLIIVAMFSLFLTGASVCTTIALRITVSFLSGGITLTETPTYHALTVVQVATVGISLITNLLSTSAVGIYVWKYRRFVRNMLKHDKDTKMGRVLVLFAESGLLYSLFVTMTFVGRFLKVTIGTVEDITGSVLAHLSGIYPTVIIIVVSLQGTVHSSQFTVNQSVCVDSVPSAADFTQPPTQQSMQESKVMLIREREMCRASFAFFLCYSLYELRRLENNSRIVYLCLTSFRE
ncbi:uncharacterized protein STEHIDRAFT_117024 [Stereum hirsutum FP-91666 SS1]|uniref:uncharacterized protein n=1 Tax=Stereum hirsutum (strain FP-91666) TaxID=721885 RepID=UPI000440C11D|nr:uncharacterized protein STEHIDRAFT_117024 [Stereum hirsutum FP-91666 SS1]EIM91922.1 hypothetical protein STEHIDRAFT_117024 [Stereum hirsutum FP-91666 SS1]